MQWTVTLSRRVSNAAIVLSLVVAADTWVSEAYAGSAQPAVVTHSLEQPSAALMVSSSAISSSSNISSINSPSTNSSSTIASQASGENNSAINTEVGTAQSLRNSNEALVERLAKQQQVTLEIARLCWRLDPNVSEDDHANNSLRWQRLQQCASREQLRLEVVEVHGEYIGPEVPEVTGRYHLDREFIDRVPKNTGDINDVVVLLPGVQGSESHDIAERQGEIDARLLSISGGQPWQTGFFVDGVNINSRLNPTSEASNVQRVNDISGAPQSFIINQQIVESVDVYDNNVPAKFGDFSGGVVSVNTRSPLSTQRSTMVSLEYRTTQSDWNQYHLLDLRSGDSSNEQTVEAVNKPTFEKQNYSLNVSHRFNEKQGIVLVANFLTSDISKLTLLDNQPTQRESQNFLLKYTQRDLGISRVDFSMTYAPFQSQDLLKNVQDSNYTQDNGGFSTQLTLGESWAWGDVDTQLSYNQSESTRNASPHYFIWRRSPGKSWGLDDPNGEFPVSLQGGYGDLENTQTALQWTVDAELDAFEALGALHFLSVGTMYRDESIERLRHGDHYYYNAARQYSSLSPLDCNGATLDCVERSFKQPLSEIEAALGGVIDFTNPAHVQAYMNNIATTPQYFESRLVFGSEAIDVSLQQTAVYLSHLIEWEDIQLTMGLRYEHDDFFKNHNLAPRLTLGYNPFGDSNTLLTLGWNRYYDTGLLTYRLRESKLPYYTQFRRVQQGVVQQWELSSADSDYRYKYEDVRTPFNDEIVVGLKQRTDNFGTFSVKYVDRQKRDQLASANEAILGEDGYRYLHQTNEGEGFHKRYSFAWHIQYQQNSFWMNASHSENYLNNDGFAQNIDNVPADELVWFDTPVVGEEEDVQEIVTRSELNRRSTNYSRPYVANLGWSRDWSFSLFDENQQLTTSLTATYTSGYTTAVATDGFRSSGKLSRLCPECEVSSIDLPVYRRADIQARTVANIGLGWAFHESDIGLWKLNIDINNLFDSRTFLVLPGQLGIETGRQIWLGVSYQYR